MAQLARHPPVGWPTELTPAVVRKHFPRSCASCPLGNLQDTDRYDNFEPTVIGGGTGPQNVDRTIWKTSLLIYQSVHLSYLHGSQIGNDFRFHIYFKEKSNQMGMT